MILEKANLATFSQLNVKTFSWLNVFGKTFSWLNVLGPTKCNNSLFSYTIVFERLGRAT